MVLSTKDFERRPICAKNRKMIVRLPDTSLVNGFELAHAKHHGMPGQAALEPTSQLKMQFSPRYAPQRPKGNGPIWVEYCQGYGRTLGALNVECTVDKEDLKPACSQRAAHDIGDSPWLCCC